MARIVVLIEAIEPLVLAPSLVRPLTSLSSTAPPGTSSQLTLSSHELAAVTLTEAISHSNKVLGAPAYVLYLDAQSAFDLALKEFMINNLYGYGICDQGIIIINERLQNRKTVCEFILFIYLFIYFQTMYKW